MDQIIAFAQRRARRRREQRLWLTLAKQPLVGVLPGEEGAHQLEHWPARARQLQLPLTGF